MILIEIRIKWVLIADRPGYIYPNDPKFSMDSNPNWLYTQMVRASGWVFIADRPGSYFIIHITKWKPNQWYQSVDFSILDRNETRRRSEQLLQRYGVANRSVAASTLNPTPISHSNYFTYILFVRWSSFSYRKNMIQFNYSLFGYSQ